MDLTIRNGNTGSGLAPAQKLLGFELDGGWRVVEPVSRPTDATGGNFSEGYIVENSDGKRGYLKALDFSGALQSSDPARELQQMTTAFNYERDLLDRCKRKRLSRVVISIDHGAVRVEDSPAGVVQYLVFDLADSDIRAQMDVGVKFTVAWALRALHNIATGLSQLHKEGIAHQDLKPSNVLVFKGTPKIGDLGRAVCKGEKPPHYDHHISGDFLYAPPELLYGHVSHDWNKRRYGCDAYLLGSMATFLFVQSSMTGLLMGDLDVTQHWRIWAGSFTEILPFLRQSFNRALDQLGENVPVDFRKDVLEVVQQLCDPDPDLRGHPKARLSLGNQYSLERYISRFNLLASQAEFMLGRILG